MLTGFYYFSNLTDNEIWMPSWKIFRNGEIGEIRNHERGYVLDIILSVCCK